MRLLTGQTPTWIAAAKLACSPGSPVGLVRWPSYVGHNKGERRACRVLRIRCMMAPNVLTTSHLTLRQFQISHL